MNRNDFIYFFFFFQFTHSANTYWFLVPICAPFLGAVVGVLMYQLMIGYHLERDAREKQKTKDEEEEEEETFKLSGTATSGKAWARQNSIDLQGSKIRPPVLCWEFCPATCV